MSVMPIFIKLNCHQATPTTIMWGVLLKTLVIIVMLKLMLDPFQNLLPDSFCMIVFCSESYPLTVCDSNIVFVANISPHRVYWSGYNSPIPLNGTL